MGSLDNNPKGRAFLGIQFTFTVLSIVFVALRLLSRRLTSTRLVFNDYAILAALVFVIGDAIAGTLSVLPGGAGLPIAQVSYPNREIFAKAQLAQEFAWLVANSFFKLSLLHFLLNIFRRKPFFPQLVYTVMALVGLSCTAFVIGTFLICQPLSYNWNPAQPGACGGRGQLFLASSVTSLLVDVAIFVLPLPVVWSLQMRTARKVAVVAVFGLGAANIAVAALRIAAIAVLTGADPTATSVSIGIYSILDITLGVINACLPLLPPLFKAATGRSVFSWSKRSTSYNYPKGQSGGGGAHSGGPRSAVRPDTVGDVTSLAWAGANRSNAATGNTRTKGFRESGHTRGGPQPQPLAFDSGVSAPSGPRSPMGRARDATRLDGRWSDAKSPDARAAEGRRHLPGFYSPPFLQSTAPTSRSLSRSLSQSDPAKRHTRESRSGSRVGLASLISSGVASLAGSRMGSRSASRSATRLDSRSGDDGGGLVGVELGRRESSENLRRGSEGSMEDGITVTKTWNVDVANTKYDEAYNMDLESAVG